MTLNSRSVLFDAITSCVSESDEEAQNELRHAMEDFRKKNESLIRRVPFIDHLLSELDTVVKED